MSRRRKALTAIAATRVIVLALRALGVARLFTGPSLPAGAERLHITTAAPNSDGRMCRRLAVAGPCL